MGKEQGDPRKFIRARRQGKKVGAFTKDDAKGGHDILSFTRCERGKNETRGASRRGPYYDGVSLSYLFYP